MGEKGGWDELLPLFILRGWHFTEFTGQPKNIRPKLKKHLSLEFGNTAQKRLCRP